jgi:hypothetical protein
MCPHGRFQHCFVRLICYSSTCMHSSATFRIHLAKIPPSILLQLQSNLNWKLLIALARCPNGHFQYCLVRLICYSSTCTQSSATFRIHLAKIPPSILLQLQSNCNWKLLIALARCPHGRFQHCLVRLLCYSSTCTHSSATFRIHLAKIPPTILLQLQSNCNWKLLIALARCPHGRFQHCLVRLLCYSSTCMHSSATFRIHLAKIPPSILLQLQSNCNWKLLIALARCPHGRFQHCLVRLLCYSSTCMHSSATFRIHLAKIPPSILLQLQSNLNWKLLIALARCPHGRFQL